MSRALIGATGFVGGNLRDQAVFDGLFHSRNIAEIRGQRFDLVVCAGAPAQKWKANQEPEADRAAIDRLISGLAGVEAQAFVLVSTVDVYPAPDQVDEDSPIDRLGGHAYGRHRLLLEDFVRERFPEALVIRLPALFGKGLKKNIVYDILHQNEVEKIDPRGIFQWYGLRTLWADIQRARMAGLRLVNFATEPVSVDRIAREAFGVTLTPRTAGQAARYDFRTKHAALFGGKNGYMEDVARVLGDLRGFLLDEGWQRP